MKLIKDIYQRDNPNIDVIYNSGSSGALQQQVERGAPIDIFISASSKQMDFLLKKNLLIRESNKTFLKNKMVLVASKKSIQNIDLNTLTDGNFEKLALGEFRSVPAGQYAKEALTALKVYNKLESKFIFGKNVKCMETFFNLFFNVFSYKFNKMTRDFGNHGSFLMNFFSDYFKIPKNRIKYLKNEGHYDNKPTPFRPRKGKNFYIKNGEDFNKSLIKLANGYRKY